MEKDKFLVAILSILCVIWLSLYSSQSTLLVVLILSIVFQSSIVSYFHHSEEENVVSPKKHNVSSVETKKLLSSFKTMKKAYPEVMKDYQGFIQKLVKEYESSNLLSPDDLVLLFSEFETICTELDISLFGSVPKAYSRWKSVDMEIRNILNILQQRNFKKTHHFFPSYPSNSYYTDQKEK